MIKKLYDKCVQWAGHRYAKPILAFESFIESSFFPIPPDVMIIPMVVAKKNEFIRIALITTIFFGHNHWCNHDIRWNRKKRTFKKRNNS